MAARRSYTAAFKLNVVAYAKEMGNRAAGTLFCVNEKQIRYWKKQEDLLRVSHKSKRANRGGAARWSLLEDLLESWVLEQVAQGRSRLCTNRVIVQKAKAIARERNIQGFIGGPSWCLRFLRRKKLLFVNVKSRNKMTTGNLQQPRQHCAAASENFQLQQQQHCAAIAPENSYNNNLSNNNEDLLNNFNLMISSDHQIKDISQMQLDPKEIFLSNCEEQLDLRSNDIRNEKEIIQEEQEDCNLRMIETESPPLEKSESVVMHTCPPISSKRLLVVPDHQHSLMSSLASMWKEQKMCDASIGNGTTIIKVHKVILLAISSTLLSSSEVKTNCFLRVNFPSNISENAMKAFAEYMYNGVLDLDPLTLTQLQQISYQLGIKNLQLLCENQLFAQSQSSRSIDNIIFPGVSLLDLAAQPESSSESVSIQNRHHSEPDFRKRISQTNSCLPLATDQEFPMHNPVLLKTEPQSSISADSFGNSRPAKAMACPFDETSHSQRPSTASGTKPSQISKMIRDQAVKSQLTNHIKIEPVDDSKSEYNQRFSIPKTNLTSLNSENSDSCKLNSISVYPKFTRNKINPLASTRPLHLSESNVLPSSCDKSMMCNQSENNSINSIERSAHPTTDNPYPVMLFSSEVSNLPIGISKTTNNKSYVNFKS